MFLIFLSLCAGNNSADMDIEEIEIERIDVAEFKNKKICSAPMIGLSTRQESTEGFSAASPWKNVDIVSKKPYASLDLSPEDVSLGSVRGLLVHKGYNLGSILSAC